MLMHLVDDVVNSKIDINILSVTKNHLESSRYEREITNFSHFKKVKTQKAIWPATHSASLHFV